MFGHTQVRQSTLQCLKHVAVPQTCCSASNMLQCLKHVAVPQTCLVLEVLKQNTSPPCRSHTPCVPDRCGVRGKRGLWSGLCSAQMLCGGLSTQMLCGGLSRIASRCHIAWCYAISSFASRSHIKLCITPSKSIATVIFRISVMEKLRMSAKVTECTRAARPDVVVTYQGLHHCLCSGDI